MKKIFLATIIVFLVNVGSALAEIKKEEQQKIDSLIDQIETSEVTFIRNGSEYSPTQAAAHLRFKMKFAGSEVTCLKDFIQKLATVSYKSGKPYLVKIKGEKVITAKEWLNNHVLASVLQLADKKA